MDVEFEDLTYKVRPNIFEWRASKKKTILSGVNGRFRAGELSAILGPSGSGKTSLLNALSGFSSAGVEGWLKTNGQPRDESKFRKMSCYITQEDLLLPLLSLDEVMKFAASLKLPPHYSRKQRRAVVSEVQNMLGLNECKDTRTESLSGGQKKRLSVALELINNPPVLFLDEPTSGLDNVSTLNLLKLLRNLAHQGRTMICTIHQPSASMFYLFDHVYVLAAGQCVYQGAPQELIPFLSENRMECPRTYNPADFVIELTEDDRTIEKLSKSTNNGKITRFKKTAAVYAFDRQNSLNCGIPLVDFNSAKDDPLANSKSIFSYGRNDENWDKNGGSCSDFSVSCWSQFCTLWSRMMLQTKRNKTTLILQVINHVFCSVIFGTLFYQLALDGSQFFNHMKFCIGIVLFHTYTYCMTPILAYPFEVKILKKENFNQWYGLNPYYLALTLSRFPVMAFFSMIFLSITFFLAGIPYDLNRFFVYCVVGVMTSFVAEGMGLFIGSVFSVTNGTAVGPLSLAPFLGLAIYGFDFAREIPLHMQALCATSFMRAGVKAMILAVFGMDREFLHCDELYCHFQNPKIILYYVDLDNHSPWFHIFHLSVITLIFRMMVYGGLWWRLRT